MTAEACSVHSFNIFSYSLRKSLVFVVVEKYINEATKVAHLNLDEKVVHFKSASSIQCKYALISNIIRSVNQCKYALISDIITFVNQCKYSLISDIIRSVNQCKYALISDIIRLVNYTHSFRCSTDATNQIMIRGSI